MHLFAPQKTVVANVRQALAPTRAGRTIRYKGEPDTETNMEIRVSADGKTYRVSFTSGKFTYQCQTGKVLQGGKLEEVECDDQADNDPNRPHESATTPTQVVWGSSLNKMTLEASDDAIDVRDSPTTTTITFTRDKKREERKATAYKIIIRKVTVVVSD